jgi:hypothetical protein
MPATYDSLATTTLGSAGNVTFSSIPSGYTDLRVVIVGTAESLNTLRLRFNGDTGTNYATTYLQGSGSTASSLTQSSLPHIQLGSSRATGSWSLVTIDILSYSGSIRKGCLFTQSNDDNGSGNVYAGAGTWTSTSAINQVSITASSVNAFNSGATATLYGILRA